MTKNAPVFKRKTALTRLVNYRERSKLLSLRSGVLNVAIEGVDCFDFKYKLFNLEIFKDRLSHASHFLLMNIKN